MHAAPPLNASLRAFEAAARHLSLTKAAQELNVTPGAISHQIRGLETLLGVELFERRARSIALTPAGKLLHPGVQTGLLYIREAVASIQGARQERILVVSTPPGLTGWRRGSIGSPAATPTLTSASPPRSITLISQPMVSTSRCAICRSIHAPTRRW